MKRIIVTIRALKDMVLMSGREKGCRIEIRAGAPDERKFHVK